LQPPASLQSVFSQTLPTVDSSIDPSTLRFGPMQTTADSSTSTAGAATTVSPDTGGCAGAAGIGYDAPEVKFIGVIGCVGSGNGTTKIKVCPQIDVPSGFTDYGNCGTKTDFNGVSLTVYRAQEANRRCRTYIYTTIPADNPEHATAYSGPISCKK
jgi:hypothetical protein